jgi:hypothetical protein
VPYGFLADVLVIIHVAFMAYVVVGQLLILIGILAGWDWVRNLWFRLSHLLAILIVALETVAGIACPLTIWERQLRELAHQPVSDLSFVGQLMHAILFYDLPEWVFSTAYLIFFALVVATFVFAPPRRRRRTQPLHYSVMPGESV